MTPTPNSRMIIQLLICMCVNENHSIDNLTITRAIGLQLTKKRLITMKRNPGDDG